MAQLSVLASVVTLLGLAVVIAAAWFLRNRVPYRSAPIAIVLPYGPKAKRLSQRIEWLNEAGDA